MRIILFLELLPETNSTAARATFSFFARNLTSSRFAAPSTGGAATRIRSAPSCKPAISLREARGTTRTEKVTPVESSRYHATRLQIVNRISEMVNEPQCQKNWTGQSRSSVAATAIWQTQTTAYAINGETSNMLTVGTNRRSGPSNGSVMRTISRKNRLA
jgi:hypothetical protein